VTTFPLRYAHGNILFGPRGETAALYRLETVSYPFLPKREKELWFGRLARFAFACEADFSLWRVSRAYPVEAYVAEAAALADERHADAATWRDYLLVHEGVLSELHAHAPDVFVAISLAAEASPRVGASLLRAADSMRRRAEGLFGVAAPSPVLASELSALVEAEERTFARLTAILPARRATTRELQRLLRRAPVRGIAEPKLEGSWEPNALLVEAGGHGAHYEPLETDIARLAGATIIEEARALVVDAEEGRSYQALLCLGALPEEAIFPGAHAELLSGPLEALDFPVDAVLHARWVGNRDALARARRRILDADDVFAEEAHGRHGPTWSADDNRTLARELHAYLDSESRPPLLRAAISLAVAAPSRDEVEHRVERLRAQYGTVSLFRPLGLQLALFLDHLPRADTGRVWDYGDYLTIEQFGALMPLASHGAGARRGVYIGATTAGARRPVLFDVAAPAREARPPSVLLAGTLGSGKTIAAELIAIQAALRGALVVDVDPKPDHNLENVPALQGRVAVIELSGEERYRGMLDPLRIAPASLREDLASSVFIELLPQAPPSWETQIRRAIRDTLRAGEQSSLAVLERLSASAHPDAREASEALAVWADSGLARLAFGASAAQAVALTRPVTTIKASALHLPTPGTPRSDYSQSERVAVAILKLVAAFALRLVSGDRTRAKVVLFDEAWFLLASSDGRRLVDRLNRLGRAENAALLLATQQLADVGDVENLIGARFIFGQETAAEAERALALLGLDPRDRELVQRVRSYRRGRCLFRDIDDRIAELQVDVVDPHLLAVLDTTPGRKAVEAAA
jgi:hypothetical protein